MYTATRLSSQKLLPETESIVFFKISHSEGRLQTALQVFNDQQMIAFYLKNIITIKNRNLKKKKRYYNHVILQCLQTENQTESCWQLFLGWLPVKLAIHMTRYFEKDTCIVSYSGKTKLLSFHNSYKHQKCELLSWEK